MNIKKIVFFYKQLSAIEFCKVAINRILGRVPQPSFRNTIMFFEERFKDKSVITRKGRASVIDWRINNGLKAISVRRFTSDVLVFTQIMIKKEFDPVIEVFNRNDFIPEYIIDGGANIGLATLYFKSYFTDAKVAAIEPNDETYDLLKQNLYGNQLDSCRIFQAGLWSQNETLQPRGSNEEGDEWGFSVISKGDNFITNSGIEGRTIFSIVQELGWSRIDYLKLDVEGAEEELFRDKDLYDGFLSMTHAISIEIHRNEFEAPFKHILVTYGFQLYEFGELIVGFRKEARV